MFSKILSLLFLTTTVFGQANIITPSNIRSYKQFKNYVINPDAEKNITDGIVDSSSILTRDTSSNRLNGLASFAIDGTASGQKVKFRLNTLDNKFAPGNAEFSFQYRATFTNAGGDYKVYVENNSGVKKSAEYPLLTTNGSPAVFTGTFVGDSTLDSPYFVSIESTVASPAVVYKDDVYGGDVTSIGQFSAVSEPINAGAMTIGAVTSAPTKATTRQKDSVTYTREGKYAYITYRYEASSAAGSAAGTGVYLWSLPAGLVMDTTLQPNTGGVASGSITSSASAIPGNANFYSNTGPSGFFSYVIGAYSSTQFFINYQQLGSTGNGFISSTNVPITEVQGFQITIKVPIQGWSASQSAAAANQTDFGWRNAGPVTITGTTTNPTKGTVVIDEFWYKRTGPNLEFIYNYRQTGAGANGSGDYLYTLPSVTGCTIDTTVTRTNTTIGVNSAANEPSSVGVAGVGSNGVAAGTGYVSIYSTTQFRLIPYVTSPANTVQSTGSATFALGNTNIMYTARASFPCLNWAENQRAPTLIGSVTSNSVGALAYEVIRFSGGTWATNQCTSSPCTLNYSSNSGATLTRTGTGLYTINFPAGLFSQPPACTINLGNNANVPVAVFNAASTATAIPFASLNGVGGALDVWGNIICSGPR